MTRPRLLFLAHRIPYPPDKGEKIRAFHMLEHLAKSFDVELGCLIDDAADLANVDALRALCAHVEYRTTRGRLASAARALMRLRPGAPLSLGWFHDAGLHAWARQGLDAGRYRAVLVFSSAMAPYAMGARPGVVRVLDMVDVDSEKFRAYAATAGFPLAQVYAREARTLLAFERRAAAAFDCTLLVSAAEAARFAELAPEVADRVDWVENGVDFARFDPAQSWPNPFPDAAPRIVFTGTMGYRPNVEAVTWFADHVLPGLRSRDPAPEFCIVGANPTPAVQALAARPGVRVTGAVPQVQPYLAHAALAVAPLLLARGIQNKVLEAMAMARPVVATRAAFEGVHAEPGRDLLVADAPEAFAGAAAALLDGAHPGMGAAGRAAVIAGHDWAATLRRLDRLLGGVAG